MYAVYGLDRLWASPEQPMADVASSAGDDDDDEDGVATTEGASGAQSDSVRLSPERPPRYSEAVQLLRAELDELRERLASSPQAAERPLGFPAQLSLEAPLFLLAAARTDKQVDARRNFAFDSAPLVRIPETAIRMEADRTLLPSAGAGVGFDLPASIPGGGPPLQPQPCGFADGATAPEIWAPHRTFAKTQMQAGAFLEQFNAWEGSKASNPYWARYFWQDVAKVEAQGFEPDLKRLFLVHGYIGPGTLAPPRGPRREALTAYKETGGP